jgi:hypothetical protein
VGVATGVFVGERGDWPTLVDMAWGVSTFATELAAISESELPTLLAYLEAGEVLPFGYLSVHAPSKGRTMPESDLVELLCALPPVVDAIVFHPDTMVDPFVYRGLGRRLVLENMDTRKATGRTADELTPYLDALPEAGLCFDVAHAADVDRSLTEGHRFLSDFAHRLRHVHVSSLDESGHHVALTASDERAFTGLLNRCRDVPWILEAPLREP